MLSFDASKGTIGEALRDDPCKLLYQLAAERPGEPASLQFGNDHLLIFQDAAAFRRVLRENPDNYRKNFGSFVAFFGRSRLTSDGDRWRYLHKLTQPILARLEAGRIVRATVEAYSTASQRMLSEKCGNAVMAVNPYLDVAAAGVMFEAALELRVSELSAHVFQDLRTLLLFSGQMTWNLPAVVVQSDRNSAAEADDALLRVRQALLTLAERERSKTRRESAFVEALLTAEEEKVDLVGEMSSQLFAGFDTTASAIGWAIWLLANQPTLQESLRTRVREVLSGGQPQLAHIEQVPQLTALIQEAMRMFPPVPILSRVAVEADRVSDLDVAPRQRVLLSIIGLHHDSGYWREPSRMDIGRFLSGEVTAEQREHHMAFSAGQRACGGSRFAMIEMPIAIMTLLSRLRFTLAEQEPMRFTWSASLRRRNGIQLCVAGV